MNDEELENRFTYHAPEGNQAERYENIRMVAKGFAAMILSNTPESREQSLSITRLEEAVFWANASIARRENKT